MWLCQCDCGSATAVHTGNLRSGNTLSCGCWRRAFERANKTHGKSHSKIHGVWNGMIQRCTNTNSASYEDYGARGITVCERWRQFANFYADMGESNGLTLERIDNNGGYSRENCRWATRQEQGQNKRNNVFIFHLGHTKTLTQWAREYGISDNLLRTRFVYGGWTIERALNTPKRVMCL